MKELFSNPATLSIVMTFSIPIVGIIAYYWHLTLKNQADNELKRSMLERGMSAEDIERVINATSGNQEKEDD